MHAHLCLILFVGVICCWASPARAGDDLTLARKAMLFETDMVERFLVNRQIAPKLKVPTEARSFVAYNMPDNAYMTGLYCAAESWRFAATGDAEARRLAGEAVAGMDHLLEVTGRTGLLARASLPIDMPFEDDGLWRESPGGDYRWRGDVSSDQVDGVIFGYYVFFKTLATRAEKASIGRKVRELVGTIIEDGLTIKGYESEVTTWGHYEPPYVREREPMNALLMLQMLKVADYVTGEERFAREYSRLIEEEGYALLAERAWSARPPQRVNHSDNVLIAIALHPLLELEKDPDIRAHYMRGAERFYRGAEGYPGVEPEDNPFFTFLYRQWRRDGGGESPSETGDEIERAKRTLKLAPLDMKFNRATIAEFEKRFEFSFDPAPVSAAPAPGLPVPIDRRAKSWSFIVQNPYTSAGNRTADSGMEFQGLDYTLGYWFGRAHGMIGAEQ